MRGERLSRRRTSGRSRRRVKTIAPVANVQYGVVLGSRTFPSVPSLRALPAGRVLACKASGSVATDHPAIRCEEQIEGSVITGNVVPVRAVVCIPVVAWVFSKTKSEKFGQKDWTKFDGAWWVRAKE